MPSLEEKLMDLINSHGVDNESDTPDYILSEYILGCLEAFTKAMQARKRHFGPRPHVLPGPVEGPGSANE